MKYRLLALDSSFVALDKPAGACSVPGKGALAQGSAIQWAQQHWPEAKTVHRLDMATSGLLLLARGAHWQRHYSRLFESRQVHKHYEAIVEGLIEQDTLEMVWPLSPDWPERPRQKVDLLHGKPARTRLQVLHRDPLRGCTRVRLEPVTGRTHQLRVHLMTLGHPIWGDRLYAPESVQARSPRTLLHACGLEMPHPFREFPCTLRSECPF